MRLIWFLAKSSRLRIMERLRIWLFKTAVWLSSWGWLILSSAIRQELLPKTKWCLIHIWIPNWSGFRRIAFWTVRIWDLSVSVLITLYWLPKREGLSSPLRRSSPFISFLKDWRLSFFEVRFLREGSTDWLGERIEF